MRPHDASDDEFLMVKLATAAAAISFYRGWFEASCSNLKRKSNDEDGNTVGLK